MENPMSDDPFAPVRQVQALARLADEASTRIFQHLLARPQDPDAEFWRRAMRDLDAAAAQLDTEALRLMSMINADALKALSSATGKAEAFLRQTAEIQKGLKMFASVLGLAGALLSGAGPSAVIKAAKALKDAASEKGGEKEG